MSEDIVKRLRWHHETGAGDAHATAGEAADEIERQRAELANGIDTAGYRKLRDEYIAAERERCAKIAERYCDNYWRAQQIAAAIRKGEPIR